MMINDVSVVKERDMHSQKRFSFSFSIWLILPQNCELKKILIQYFGENEIKDWSGF